MPNILDYFPNGWQPSKLQAQVLRELELRWNSAQVFVLKLDVASGKSPVAVCIARWLAAQNRARKSGARICTPTNVLVDQYAKTFPDEAIVKSAGNYVCDTRERRCGSFSAAQRCKGCVYTTARNTAKAAKISISTYHMNMALREKRVAMIFDEAHNIPKVIRDMKSPRIFAHRVLAPREIVGSNTLTHAWVKSLTAADFDRMTQAEAKLLKEYQKDLRADKPLHFYTWETDWWSNGGDMWGEKLVRGEPTEAPVLKQLPIHIADKTNQFWDDTQKLVLMSATIGKPDLYELGLDRTRPVFIEGDPPIDPSRNPIIKDYIGTMSHHNMDTMVPKLAERIQELLNTKKGRGVIHVTYALARKLQPLLKHKRLITHNPSNMRTQLKKFTETEDAVFLVSGMYEGVSLDYDLANWQVVTKVVWPSLADPLQKYYSEKDMDYYFWSTIKTMVQISGRVCRRPDDYGETFVWDASFDRMLDEGKHLIDRNFSNRIV